MLFFVITKIYFHFKFNAHWRVNKSFNCFTIRIKHKTFEICNISKNPFGDFKKSVHIKFQLSVSKGMVRHRVLQIEDGKSLFIHDKLSPAIYAGFFNYVHGF